MREIENGSVLIDKQYMVWARDPSEGFVSAKIGELLADGVEVFPLDARKPKRVLPFDDIFPAVDQHYDVEDNCELLYLNEATLLNNIRIRYAKEKIYTYVANILIAVNPYKEIRNLYSSQTIRNYQGKSLGEMPPHVFAIADKSFRDMKVFKQSQSIIVSGESGAGKTESTKYLLRYLCELWGSTAGPIEQKILDANPILEAFGNAKTTRNHNSSRFGKFMEIHFDSRYQVVGGYISHYLLEKSRICSQTIEERSYHVFYLLAAGAPQSIRNSLQITRPEDFHYLKNGCTQFFVNTTLKSSSRATNRGGDSDEYGDGGGGASGKNLANNLLDDYEDFAGLDKALTRLNLSESERLTIYATVAAVLHLGNICFEDISDETCGGGGCRVTKQSERALNAAAQLLGIEAVDLHQALVSRVMQSNRGGFKGTIIMVPLKVAEAANARDALAKALYSHLFDRIVLLINKSIPFRASAYYIGVLDIAGFEYFTTNSFEQFCINYCNEKLQQFFNERILKFEQHLYRKEALNVPEIKFVDNQDCIDLIETRSNGILTLLDEESKLPRSDFEHFTAEVHSRWANHFRLSVPRSSKLKAHRSIRDNEGFLIRHFAGAVCYQTKQFIEKNNDALHASLEALIQESSNGFVQSLFLAGASPVSGTTAAAPPPSPAATSQKGGKLTFISVGSKFKSQLGELMEKLQRNGTNFIRCIKPNNRMIDGQFDGQLCLTQLECSGMKSVLELMAHGYPSRVPFAELHSMYRPLLPEKLLALDSRSFCDAVLHSLRLKERDFRFGVTRVFFRPGKFAEFDRIMKSDPENLREIVDRVQRWLVKSRWIKSIFCSLSVIKLKNKILYRRNALITVQKVVRGFLSKKVHRPRFTGIVRIRGLLQKLGKLDIIGAQLKNDSHSRSEISSLESAIFQAIKQIQENEKILKDEIDAKYSSLLAKINGLMGSLQKRVFEQKNREEQIRLEKIQQQIEREKCLKEAEEKQAQIELDNRKKKAEMENRRKLEDCLDSNGNATGNGTVNAMTNCLEDEFTNALRLAEAEEERFRERREQERHDHELALRLAQESNDQLEESPTMLRNNGLVVAHSSWTLKNSHRSQIESSNTTQLSTGSNNNIGSMCMSGASFGSGDLDKKYDLSKWKYSELRDTINTSCDIELLEACRHEFHRRLKVYHAWKAKNRKKSLIEDNDRAPYSIMEAAFKSPKKQPQYPDRMQGETASTTMTSAGILTNQQQRFFRIPFVRTQPSENTASSTNNSSVSTTTTTTATTASTNKRGWWYAHFDGQYVARQMELHPDKMAVLLVAGIDDMQMCELSLDETGLTRKKGAEILETEFNAEWNKHGGPVYKTRFSNKLKC